MTQTQINPWPHQRPTIGLLTYGVEDPNNDAIWSGVADVARRCDSNLICFPGKPLRSPVRFNAQANVLYDLVTAQNLNGLVIWVGALAHHVPVEEVLAFCQRYRPLPMVSVALLLDGIPSVVIDWRQIMHEAMSHLIEVHGRRRIAFIRGPQGHPGPEKRFQAYLELLSAHDLTFDPTLIASGFLRRADGVAGIHQLLDERGRHFDAVVAMDEMALGAIAELDRRGIHVPEDVAVIGLNGIEQSKYATPPLTNVPFQAYEQAQRATEILFDLLAGRAAPEKTSLATQIVVRQSCGCLPPMMHPQQPPVAIHAIGPAQLRKNEQVLEAMVQPNRGHRPDRLWAAQLLDAFTDEIEGRNSKVFRATLSHILRQAAAANDDISLWQGAISALRNQALHALSGEDVPRIEELCHQARVMVAEMAERVQGNQRSEAERLSATLGAVIQRFVTTYEVHELGDVLAAELPRLGIRSCYLSLYEDPKAPAEWSKLVLAYDESGRCKIENGELRFRSQHLTPDGMLPTARQYEMVVEPLYFREEQIGFALFEVGPREGMLYETLRRQISSALRGALLFEHNAELYQEALKAKTIAEKADRLKTRLLANVSHELRHPLNVILGYTQTSTPGVDARNPTASDPLPHIHQSAEHLLRLINDLLDLSRAEIDELPLYAELIEPCAFLSEVFQDARASNDTSEEISWRLEMPSRFPKIQADPVRLRQILLNLLSNAQKFTQKGRILLGAEVTAPYLHIGVEDTGVGIPVKAQEDIFEPFNAAEQANRRSGIGLGLSITRRLVALHCGHMSLESQPGRGSAFHVYLPLPTLSDQPVAVQIGGEPTLLYLSSAAQPAAEIREIGDRQGLALRQLKVGDDLQQLLTDIQPALLAWDLGHRHGDEWMIIQRLRHHPQLSHIPFILYGQEQATNSNLTTGLTNFVTKPIRAENLQDAITALAPDKTDGPILIVDDDPQMRALHQDIVATAFPACTAIAVEDGAQALLALAEQTPSLVILDLMMPEVDGFTVLDQLRAEPKTHRTPVVIVSGRSLTAEDVARLERHAQVIVQSKDILSDAETINALHRARLGDELLPPNTSALVKRGLSYIQQNFARQFSRQDLATAVGASENYLTEVFHQEMGLSPWEYLNRYRVTQAQARLRETDATVSAIAQQVGFNDSSYFGRVFRKQVGNSPSVYRKQNR